MHPSQLLQGTLALIGLCSAAPAFAVATLDLALRADSTALAEGSLQGELEYRPEGNSPEVCFYLPYLDPAYVFDPARGFSPSVSKYGNVQKVPGTMKLEGAKAVSLTQPWLVRLPMGADGTVRGKFRSRLPYWPDNKQTHRWLYNDAYPQPLLDCPSAAVPSLNYRRELGMAIRAKVDLPEGWELVSPAETVPADSESKWNLSFKGAKLTFGVARGYLGEDITVAGIQVRVAYHSEYFRQYLSSIPRLIAEQVAVNGPLPFKRLVILETDDLEKARIPGIVTINQPKQSQLLKNEKSAVHWTIWQLANFLSEQWVGVAIAANSFDNDWLVRGAIDTTAYLALQGEPDWENFFAPREGKRPWFDLFYRESTDILAALLTYATPENSLTDGQLNPVRNFGAQHPLSFIRHALAMRYAQWRLGRERFISLWQEFLQAHQFSTIAPKDWIQFLNDEGEQELAKIFVVWWGTNHWPDSRVVDVRESETADKKNLITVLARQVGDIVLPLQVAIETDDGKTNVVAARSAGDGLWVAEHITTSGLKGVVLQPDRAVFDWDRFNNSDHSTSWQFLPGSARSFRDDAMTVLWLPLIAKLPGENWTVLLASQIFQYMHNSVTAIASYVPQEKRAGYRLFYVTDFPWWAMYTVMSASQNFGNQTKGERVLDGGLYRKNFFLSDPDLELGLRLRYRQVIGQDDTAHPTVTFRAQLEPPNPQLCRYNVNLDAERTVPKVNERFAYARDAGKFEGNCQFFSLVGEVRTFYGVLASSGEIPGNVAFQPQDMDGPRLRMEMPGLSDVRRIGSVGVDFLGPLRLPVESFLFALPRESRWRLFYDYGRAPDERHTYHDAGVGVFMPFGGDVVGKQTMTFMRLSVLAVLYQKYDDVVNKKPAILLDILGKL